MNKYPLKLIEWRDAYNGNHDWCTPQVLEDKMAIIAQTMGFEVQRTEDQVVLAMSVSSGGHLCDLFTIPLSIIVREQTFRSKLK